jgi:predicted acyl esterase
MTRKTTATAHPRGAHRRGPTAQHPRSVPILPGADESDLEPDRPFEEGAHDTVEPDLRHRLISEAAYAMYTERGYADGYDLDDWLAAEEAVDHLILNRKRPGSGATG